MNQTHIKLIKGTPEEVEKKLKDFNKIFIMEIIAMTPMSSDKIVATIKYKSKTKPRPY